MRDAAPQLELFRTAHPAIAIGAVDVEIASVAARNVGGSGQGLIINLSGDAIDNGMLEARSVDVSIEVGRDQTIELAGLPIDGGPFGIGHTVILADLTIVASRIPDLDDVLSGKANLRDMFRPTITVSVRGDVPRGGSGILNVSMVPRSYTDGAAIADLLIEPRTA